MPQDGRIELTVGGHPVDLRVSVLPTMFGESVVMRVLDRSVVSLDLDKVGMDAADAQGCSARSCTSPTASCWSPGPTGSGKTTTLYSALSELNDDRRQADHDRRPGRVRHRRHRAGARSTPSIGNTFAHVPAGHPAAGPGQDPGRRDPRSGDGRNRRAGLAHRPHWCSARCTPTTRPSTITRLRDMGIAAVLDHRHGRSHPGPAAGAADLHAVPRESRAHRPRCCRTWTSRPPTWPARRSIAARAATPATTPATRAAWACSS